jgi:6-phosphogluconolactonase
MNDGQRLAAAISLTLCGAVGAWLPGAATAAGRHENPYVYIGTHGVGAPGGAPPTGADALPANASPQGIYLARLNAATGELSLTGLGVSLARATWLAVHPTLPVLYTSFEPGGMGANSTIVSYRIDRNAGSLQPLNQADGGGRDATAWDLDPKSATLLVANHGSGSVTALPLLADGSVGAVASTQEDFGSGPTPRQKSAAAHGIALDPSRHYVAVADFGADRLFTYHFDAKSRALTPNEPRFEAMPPGSGPRHVLFHPNGHYLLVDAELTAELRSYAWNPKTGQASLVQTVSVYPADGAGNKSAAELALSRDGRFAYVSLRGDQNSIVVYAFDSRRGTLQEIQRISSQGRTPWSFGIDPTGHWMLVTNEASDSVAELKIDPASGRLSATDQSLTVPKPVAVAFY